MSYIVTNTTTSRQAIVQIGETKNLSASIGDTIYFSGGGWTPNLDVQLFISGNLIALIHVDQYGNFISDAYPITSNPGTTPTMVYGMAGSIDDSYWTFSGTVNLTSQPVLVTVNFACNAYGTIDPSPGPHSYSDGAEVLITATPSANCYFIQWEINGEFLTSQAQLPIYAHEGDSYYAVFAATAYTLTVSVIGPSCSVLKQPNLTEYAAGQTVTLTAYSAAGYVFSGWSGDIGGSANPTQIVMNGNKTVTATFTKTQYVLVINISGSGSGIVGRSPLKDAYNSGEVVTLTATPASGSVFTSWSGNASGTNPTTTVTMNTDKSVTATFTVVQYRLIIYLPTGSGSTNPSTGEYYFNFGASRQVTATPASGWRLDHWLLDGSNIGANNPLTVYMDAPHSLQTIFVQINPAKYTLTVNKAGTGSGTVALNPAGGSYDPNTSVQLTATAASSSTFGGWSGDLTGIANPATIVMNSNKTVTATFTGGLGKMKTISIVSNQDLGVPVAWGGNNFTKTVSVTWDSAKTMITKATLTTHSYSNNDCMQMDYYLNTVKEGSVNWDTANARQWRDLVMDVTGKVSNGDNIFKCDYFFTWLPGRGADAWVYADLFIEYTGDDPGVEIPQEPFDWEKYLPYILVGGGVIVAIILLSGRGGGGVTIIGDLGRRKEE